MSEEVIVGRYRVEKRLAQGGMGEVFAAYDESTGRRVALKRMIATDDARLRGMFEREYHALVGLRHPRIIEAYDYGVDNGKPFYTMELLDGQDLRQHAPLPYRRACRYLRDVASSLALLHARKLLHRDVSPRNVRVTSDDRCKLIDFGAMSTFGLMEVVVGTPPFVAPEAVRHTPLDQRADLFALGAIAYWLLTGKQAFPARTMHELPEMWRNSPELPSDIVKRDVTGSQRLEPIPSALDELVMSLLTPNPLGRPATAVEVMERLTVIGELEPDQEELSARAYLHGSDTIGRDRERARLRKRLNHALRGVGSSVLIESAPGMGSSRLVGELALTAQLSGATPLIIDAKLHRGVYGVAHALVEKLLQTAPEHALEAARAHKETLSRFSPLFASRMDMAGEFPALPPGELRRRTQLALAEWVFAVATKRPLVIAIDNAQRLDEGSAALTATLARASRNHALLLVVARKPGETASSPAAVRAIEEAGSTIKLRGLSRDDVHALLKSLFGDVQNTSRLAEWVHQLSGGVPQACMDLVHHMVDHAVIRYAEGTWTLPHELLPHELPTSLEQALDTRLARLGAPARKLADALSVHRGQLPIERCVATAVAEGIGAPHAALEELAREEVLVQSGATYHFGHETVRERIYAGIEPERRELLHRRMGTFLAKETLDINGMLDAGWHLINGGVESQGAEYLADAAQRLAVSNDELAAAVPALHAALQVFRREKRPAHEMIRLIAPLAIAGYRVDRRLAGEYGEEAVTMLEGLIGLTLARKLRGWVGRRFALYLGLAVGFTRSLLPGHGGPSAFRGMINTFATCCTSLAGVGSICHDPERARRYASALEPFSLLGRDHAGGIAYEFAALLARLPEDNVATVAAGCEAVLKQLSGGRKIASLTADSRVLLTGGVWYALGAMNCFRDGTSALRCAEELDALGLKLYAMAADQLRAIHHALRGEIGVANRFAERVEMHAIQASTGWQAEVWQPSGMNLVYLLTSDVIGQKSVAEQNERLAKEIPTLQRHAQIARASYYQLKGEPLLAYEIRRAVLENCPPRGYIGWPATMGAQVHALVALGRAAEAKQMAEQVLDGMNPADEPYVAMYQHVWTGLCMAQAELGEQAAAVRRVEELIERHRSGAGPLTLGNLHATRVRIALKFRDSINARQHLTEMERWFRPTGNPALIGQCERLRREVLRLMQETGESARSEHTARHGADEVQTVRSVLSQCAGPNERAERALELLVRHVRGVAGYLFTYVSADDRLNLIAPQHGDDPPGRLLTELLGQIHKLLEGDEEPTSIVPVSEMTDASMYSRVEVEAAAYRLVLLTLTEGGVPRVVGAAAIMEGETPTIAPRPALLDAMARSLYDSGDDQRSAEPTSVSVTAVKVSLGPR